MMPGVKRLGERTLEINTADKVDANRAFRSLVALASS